MQQEGLVHDPAVRAAQVAVLLGLVEARVDRGRADALEGGLHLGHWPQLALGGHGVLHAEQHLQAATTGRDDTHAHFHQADVELGVAHDPLTGHRHFAAAAQGQVEGRRHCGERRIGEHTARILQPPGHFFDQVELFVLGGVQHHHQVRPGTEMLALVTQHQALETAGNVLLDGVFHQSDDAVVEGIHLAAEGEAGYVVAQVDELAAAVLGDHLAPALLALEDDHPLVFEDRIKGQRLGIQLGYRNAMFPAVEVGDALGKHLLDEGRDGQLLETHAGHDPLDAQGVPELEGPQLEGKAVPDGAIHVQRTICHLAQAIHGVGEVGRDAAPGQAAGLCIAGEQGPHLFRRIVDALQLLQDGPVLLHLRDVLAGGRVDGQEGLPALLVLGALLEEALLHLVAKQLVIQHPLEELRELEDVPHLIVRTQVVDVLGGSREDVHARQICGPEGRALGASGRIPQHQVQHLEGDVFGQGQVQGGHDAVDADAVADEGGRIKSGHHFLAETLLQPGAEDVGFRLVHLGALHELQQPQVAHGIEEVGDDEVLPEGVRAALHQELQGDARCVRADPGAGLEMRLEPPVQVALDGQVLLHHLHDPVAVR